MKKDYKAVYRKKLDEYEMIMGSTIVVGFIIEIMESALPLKAKSPDELLYIDGQKSMIELVKSLIKK